MLIARGVLGGILLFLGRELNFLLAAAMAALLSFRLTPFLPARWPNWCDAVLMFGLTILAGAIPLLNRRIGYYVSGFLAGGTFLVEYYAPSSAALPLLPFLIGSTLGALLLGIFTDWALIVITCLIGAYYITNLFALSYIPQMLVGSGLFLTGALVQAFMRRGEQEE